MTNNCVPAATPTGCNTGHDATDLSLSAGQLQLVAAVATAAAGKPVVAVIMSAVPLDLTPLIENKAIGAILYVGQPSVQCLGVGDVLFGVVAPAGRMVQTLYPVSFQHQVREKTRRSLHFSSVLSCPLQIWSVSDS